MKHIVALLAAATLVVGTAEARDAEDSFYRGVNFYEQENYVEAVGPLFEAIDADPMWAEAHQYLGRALLKLGRWVEAIENLTKAYDLMPETEKAQFWRELWTSLLAAFSSLLDLGEVDQALAVLEEGWQLSSDHPAARDELLVVLLSQGAKFLEEGRLEEWLSLLQEQQPSGSSSETIAI